VTWDFAVPDRVTTFAGVP